MPILCNGKNRENQKSLAISALLWWFQCTVVKQVQMFIFSYQGEEGAWHVLNETSQFYIAFPSQNSMPHALGTKKIYLCLAIVYPKVYRRAEMRPNEDFCVRSFKINLVFVASRPLKCTDLPKLADCQGILQWRGRLPPPANLNFMRLAGYKGDRAYNLPTKVFFC